MAMSHVRPMRWLSGMVPDTTWQAGGRRGVPTSTYKPTDASGLVDCMWTLGKALDGRHDLAGGRHLAPAESCATWRLVANGGWVLVLATGQSPTGPSPKALGPRLGQGCGHAPHVRQSARALSHAWARARAMQLTHACQTVSASSATHKVAANHALPSMCQLCHMRATPTCSNLQAGHHPRESPLAFPSTLRHACTYLLHGVLRPGRQLGHAWPRPQGWGGGVLRRHVRWK